MNKIDSLEGEPKMYKVDILDREKGYPCNKMIEVVFPGDVQCFLDTLEESGARLSLIEDQSWRSKSHPLSRRPDGLAGTEKDINTLINRGDRNAKLYKTDAGIGGFVLASTTYGGGKTGNEEELLVSVHFPPDYFDNQNS